jgi:hypothetical protein
MSALLDLDLVLVPLPRLEHQTSLIDLLNPTCGGRYVVDGPGPLLVHPVRLRQEAPARRSVPSLFTVERATRITGVIQRGERPEPLRMIDWAAFDGDRHVPLLWAALNDAALILRDPFDDLCRQRVGGCLEVAVIHRRLEVERLSSDEDLCSDGAIITRGLPIED